MHFCPRQHQDFKPSMAHLYPYMGQVIPWGPFLGFFYKKFNRKTFCLPTQSVVEIPNLVYQWALSVSVTFEVKTLSLVTAVGMCVSSCSSLSGHVTCLSLVFKSEFSDFVTLASCIPGA